MSSFNINDSFGAVLLGTIISSMLYGAMCLQAWHYFKNYSDGPLMKFAVLTVLYLGSTFFFKTVLMMQDSVLEALHSAFSIHAVYFYLILNYANPTALLKVTWSAAAIVLVTHFIRITVDMFYMWRVYIVSKRNIPLVIVMAVLEVVCLGTGLVASVLGIQAQFFAKVVTSPKVLVTVDVSLGMSAAVDILVAASLSYYLYTSKTGITKTDKMIDKLVVHVVNNGILTSIASVLSLVFATADKTTLFYLMIYQCIGHLYSNTMLSTLNTRPQMSAGNKVPTSVGRSDLYISDFQVTLPSSIPTRAGTKSGKEDLEMGIEVNVIRIEK